MLKVLAHGLCSGLLISSPYGMLMGSPIITIAVALIAGVGFLAILAWPA